MAVSYPSEFPLAESVEVVNIIRKGEVKEKLPVFAADLWWVQGYAQSQLIGKGADLSLMSQAAPAEFDALETLEKLNAAHESGQPMAEGLIPWELLLSWAIKKLLDAIQNEFSK